MNRIRDGLLQDLGEGGRVVRQGEASWEDIDRSGIKRAKAEVRIFRVTALFSTHPRLLSLISGGTPRPSLLASHPHTPSYFHTFTAHLPVLLFILLSRTAFAVLGSSALHSVSSTRNIIPCPASTLPTRRSRSCCPSLCPATTARPASPHTARPTWADTTRTPGSPRASARTA